MAKRKKKIIKAVGYLRKSINTEQTEKSIKALGPRL